MATNIGSLTSTLGNLVNTVNSTPGGAQLLASSGVGNLATNALNTANGTAAANTTGTGTAAGTQATGAAGGTTATRSMTIPATGKMEARLVDGNMHFFNAQGKEISTYDFVNAVQVDYNLDNRPGIAVGINNLGQMVAARQQRISLLSSALAKDAQTSKAVDPANLIMLQQESTSTSQISELSKSIFDNMKRTIDRWLQ